jgi:CRISPR-associated protein Cmr6
LNSDNQTEFYLINDLKDVAKEFWKKKEYENISLQIQKFVPFGWDDIKKKDKQKPKPKYQVFDYYIQLPDKAFEEYKQFYKLQESLWKSKLEECGINPDEFLKDLKLQTKSRLVVGLGDESVYETSIRLHRNYGVPYIPGSALKGAAKHYSIYKIVEENSKTLKNKFKEDDFFKLAEEVQKLLENPNDDAVREFYNLKFKLDNKEINLSDLRKIFGTQSYEGAIIFFDAFPNYKCLNGNPILELDIMNPHYQPYYQHGEAPGDWHSPTPIFFLTVPKDVTFQFAIAPRNDDGKELIGKAKEILRSALMEFGVGAKTSLGYGRFKEDP